MRERLLQHKPGDVVELCGRKYKVKKTIVPRHMCFVCALNGRSEACRQVVCSPFYRDDRTRVYYVGMEGVEK